MNAFAPASGSSRHCELSVVLCDKREVNPRLQRAHRVVRDKNISIIKTNITSELIKQRLREGEVVRLTCEGRVIFQNEPGYCGEVFEDHFEFKEVLNGYEHFSNISDYAQTKAISFGFKM